MRLQNTIERGDETKKLLQENLKISRATLKMVEKIKKHLFWTQVANWLKLILIVAPIILAILYLPPLIEKWQEQVQGIFGPFGGVGAVQKLEDVGKTLEEFQKMKE